MNLGGEGGGANSSVVLVDSRIGEYVEDGGEGVGEKRGR